VPAPHRELSRISDRHFGPGAHRPRLRAGAEIRRRSGHSRGGHRARLRCLPLFPELGQWKERQGASGGRGGRSALPAPRYSPPGGLRGAWHLVLGVAHRGPCRQEEIALVGGGNSAGQAAVFLSGFAAKIFMLVRAETLAASMSRYLIDRIEARPNIELSPDRNRRAHGHAGRPVGAGALAPRAVRGGNGTGDPQCFFVHWRRTRDQLATGLRCRPRRQEICPDWFASRCGWRRDDRDASPAAAARIECPWCVRGGRCKVGLGEKGRRRHR
jgi:hypothetical protein